MIRYSLRCVAGHRFESWFYDSASFDVQTGRGQVVCPTCDSTEVTKAIMAPALVVREAASPISPQGEPAGLSFDGERRRMARALRDKVIGETRDVGRAFAAEARRIHNGDVADERIRGQATFEEARSLLDDGILVLPVPPSPDDLN